MDASKFSPELDANPEDCPPPAGVSLARLGLKSSLDPALRA